MSLTTLHVADPDIVKAATELLVNAKRLIVAGYFAEARRVLGLLVEPGPWKLKQKGSLIQELEYLLPRACVLSGVRCPAVGRQPARLVEDLVPWAIHETTEYIDALKGPSGTPNRPVGENWSEAYLATLPDIAARASGLKAFGRFLLEAKFVLEMRLAAAFPGGHQAPSLVAEADLKVLGELLGHLVAARLIAEPAQAITTATIGSTITRFVEKTGAPLLHLHGSILQAVLLLCSREGQLDVAVDTARYLAARDALYALLPIATYEPVTEILASGACAAPLGIDPEAVALYLQAVTARPAPRPEPVRRKKAAMVDSLASFEEILSATPLGARELVELPVLDTPERAYAMELSPDEMEEMWDVARGLVAETGRWPLITTTFGDGETLEEKLSDADLFSRSGYYGANADVDDVSPRALLAAADAVDVAAFLRRRTAELQRLTSVEEIEHELERTREYCGSAPGRDDVARARVDGQPITTCHQLDRWLLGWELAHGSSSDPTAERITEWFNPDPYPAILLFLPTPNPWDALAYIPFWGAGGHGSEHYVALGRQWHERFGAELFAHFGTMLECFVSRPPTTIDEAWELGRQHDLIAQSTLAGSSLRHYAAGLVNYDRWFLHERP
jgi:hypothetical protein